MRNLVRAALGLLLGIQACSGTDNPTSTEPQTSAGSNGSGGSRTGSGGSTSAGANNVENPAGSGGDTNSAGNSGSTGGSTSVGGAGDEPGGAGGDSALPEAPLLGLLDQFVNVPKGPKESDPINRKWTAPSTLPDHPGDGIAQHPMLYAGEGYNTIFLVNGGKVIWTYSTGSGGEVDDVWMMTNGHILYARMGYLEEITPQKEVVWHYTAPAGTETHSLQPIGLDKVLFVQNGQPAKIIVMEKATNKKVVEHELADTLGVATHPQFRRIRMTASGNYLAPYLNLHKVVEYDKDFNIVWEYQLPDGGSPWAAIRLRNGNTLIQDEHNKAAREVNPQKQIVWEFKQSDLKLPTGTNQRSPQTSDRLANGNTVIFSPGVSVSNIQAIEVTPDKQVVWILQDWQNLGPGTTAQFLDQPGIPEKPGDLQH